MRPWPAEQVRTFLTATAQDRDGPLYQVLVSTGLRIGEALALRWQDLDLDAGTLLVRHTLRRTDMALTEPKTARSRRTLRLGRTAVAALRTQRVRQATEQLAAGPRWRGEGFVFATAIGTPSDYPRVASGFCSSLTSEGLPAIGLHTFGRHGFASLSLAAGVDLGTISRSLRHSNLGTTMDLYVTILPAVEDDAASRMDAILAG